jgi:hypothetical protein
LCVWPAVERFSTTGDSYNTRHNKKPVVERFSTTGDSYNMRHNKKPVEIRIFHHRFSDGRTRHHYLRQWKKLPPSVRLIIRRWKSQNASTAMPAVIRSFHCRFVRTLNTTHFNPTVVNIYQLCINVHVLNDLMALVLAVPNGERFIRSIGVWNSDMCASRNDLTVSTGVNATYYYWKFNYYRMQRSSQAS